MKIDTADGERCFVFVKVYNTAEFDDIVCHMLLLNADEGAPVYDVFPFENVRTFAIKVVNPPEMFMIPMPNSSLTLQNLTRVLVCQKYLPCIRETGHRHTFLQLYLVTVIHCLKI